MPKFRSVFVPCPEWLESTAVTYYGATISASRSMIEDGTGVLWFAKPYVYNGQSQDGFVIELPVTDQSDTWRDADTNALIRLEDGQGTHSYTLTLTVGEEEWTYEKIGLPESRDARTSILDLLPLSDDTGTPLHPPAGWEKLIGDAVAETSESRDTAKASQTAAKQSEIDALRHATNANASATDASASAAVAQGAEANALASTATAADSAEHAEAAATDAHGRADAAEASANLSEANSDSAAQSAIDAEASASVAQANSETAADDAVRAETAANRAETAAAGMEDTGWVDVEIATGFIATSETEKPQVRRINGVVYIRGGFKNTKFFASNSNYPGTVPEGFRPSNAPAGLNTIMLNATSNTANSRVETGGRIDVRLGSSVSTYYLFGGSWPVG